MRCEEKVFDDVHIVNHSMLVFLCFGMLIIINCVDFKEKEIKGRKEEGEKQRDGLRENKGGTDKEIG